MKTIQKGMAVGVGLYLLGLGVIALYLYFR